MRILLILSLISIFLSSSSQAQHKPAYALFDATGNQVEYSTMIDSLITNEIVLFGELHDNPIIHWLELEITKDLGQKKSLTLGAEMIEADNQEVLQAYLNDSITIKEFTSSASLWVNHKTDYQPLIDYAKSQNFDFIATNIPRKYASLVYKNGFVVLDTLSVSEKNFIAPLPILFKPELPRYQEILKMMGDHGSPKLVMAQAIKDATMAHFIIKNRKNQNLFIHYNGSFHSDFHEGIGWYLKQLDSTLKCVTISSVSQKELDSLENQYINQADFIIVVDDDMTTTY